MKRVLKIVLVAAWILVGVTVTMVYLDGNFFPFFIINAVYFIGWAMTASAEAAERERSMRANNYKRESRWN